MPEPSEAMKSDFEWLPQRMICAEFQPTSRPKLVREGNAVSQHELDQVYDAVLASGSYNGAAVFQDADHFFNTLGLPDDYFRRFSVKDMALHVTAYMSAKKLAMSAGRDTLSIKLETPRGHVVMTPLKRKAIMAIEEGADELRSSGLKEKTWSVSRYTSMGSAVPYGDARLAVYVMDRETFPNPNVDILEGDLEKVATNGFMSSRTPETLAIYQEMMTEKLAQLSPLLKIGEELPDGTTPIMIANRLISDQGVQMLHMDRLLTEIIGEEMTVRRKYTNKFANGMLFHSYYIENATREALESVMQRVRLVSVVPRSFTVATMDLLTSTTLTPDEYAYSAASANFAYYFLTDKHDELTRLREELSPDATSFERLQRVTAQLHRQAITQPRLNQCIEDNPKHVKAIYADFNDTFNPALNSDKSKVPAYNFELYHEIEREVPDQLDRAILKAFLQFNASTSKTNFYSGQSSTLAFRLEPSKFFKHLSQYPTSPYGIFMVMSNDFRGFHVRFMPVSRGGVRMIPSANASVAMRNRQTLFNENYGLAFTQNNKNKDIPEFGSKGTILLEPNSQNGKFYSFAKYMSGMMDLLLPRTSGLIDHHDKEEIIFFGPDEGTADVMEWAARYSKERGYEYWKACTTGKPATMGGIPHDKYGMTTRSVHTCTVELLKKLGIAEETVTKLQTGGPDGDLGSNEILMSKDQTIGIVDGSGTVFDPHGLDRTELERLAVERLMVEHFDTSKLSADGDFVSVKAENHTLPDGTLVESGTVFRNEFHFNPLGKADLFVPCGGRPESVNGTNVHLLLDDEGEPRFKYIVEGANLFITEDARKTLADAGVLLLKDASTNKGGVTSSSLEVLAALAMNDAEHEEHMCSTGDDHLPEFYKKYVDEVITIVEGNARAEFLALWEANQKTGIHLFKLTDIISTKINEINVACQNSDIVIANEELRRAVLAKALPRVLQDQLGLDTIIERLPEDYIKSVVGYYVASRYVYKYGLEGNEFKFFDYMSSQYKIGK
jgi:glutamate dehydrogenase